MFSGDEATQRRKELKIKKTAGSLRVALETVTEELRSPLSYGDGVFQEEEEVCCVDDHKALCACQVELTLA